MSENAYFYRHTEIKKSRICDTNLQIEVAEDVSALTKLSQHFSQQDKAATEQLPHLELQFDLAKSEKQLEALLRMQRRFTQALIKSKH